MPKPSRQLVVFASFLLSALLYDMVTTYYASSVPLTYESNPFASWLIQRFGKGEGFLLYFVLCSAVYIVILLLFELCKFPIENIFEGILSTIFGLRHILAGTSNLCLYFNILSIHFALMGIIRVASDFWGFLFVLLVVVAVIEEL